jgi:hypothetical protein
MARVLSNSGKTDSAPSAPLIEIARLLARQAAREWSAREATINEAVPDHLRPEKRS